MAEPCAVVAPQFGTEPAPDCFANTSAYTATDHRVVRVGTNILSNTLRPGRRHVLLLRNLLFCHRRCYFLRGWLRIRQLRMLLELSVGPSYTGACTKANGSSDDAAELCTNNTTDFGTISVAIDFLR